MLNDYNAVKHGLHLGNVDYDDVFSLLYTSKHINDYKYLKTFAKRGDLLVNIDQEQYRNYNIYIIDIINDDIIIESLDENNGYEGYPKVPIKYLDILLINNKFWYDTLVMNDDYDLDSYSIELSDSDLIRFINIDNTIHNNIILLLKHTNISFHLYTKIYSFIDNPIYYQIKNTKCVLNQKNITYLINYINYENNNLIEYKNINELFYIY